MASKHKKPRKAALVVVGDPGWTLATCASVPGPNQRKLARRRALKSIAAFSQKMHAARPAKFDKLSQEEHILPKIVNVVYRVSFQSPAFSLPLDMVRIAQYLPTSKYRPPNFASMTLKIDPITALFFRKCKIIITKATSKEQAVYYAHLYRTLIEDVPLVMRNAGSDAPYVGTLKGKLGMSIGVVNNMVGSGVLPQDGVDLSKLLEVHKDNVEYEPDAFPNLIYKGLLSNGLPFCANIAVTGKIVLMGLKSEEDVYEAYKIMCDLVYDFEVSFLNLECEFLTYDFEAPNAPEDPNDRFLYRINQLMRQDLLTAQTEADIDPDDIINMDEEADCSDDESGAERPRRPDGDDDHLTNTIMKIVGTTEPGLKDRLENADSDEDDGDGSGHGDDLPLLWQAAENGQLENVKFILDSGGDLAYAAFERDAAGRTLAERLQRSANPTKLAIAAVVTAYINQHQRK